MRALRATALAACIATAMFVGTAGTGTQILAQPFIATPPPITSTVAGVPADALPESGQCKLWYDALPAERQAAQMDCEHANWLARTWGGRVIGHDRELARYEGRNDFTGVPVAALPERGFCRAWLDGVAANAQPAESDCRVARQIADRDHGRVLYIPL